MTCYHPMKRWVIGYDGKHDKEIAKITSYSTEYVKGIGGKLVKDFQEIPCGKCIGCRLEYSRQWANRCMLEAKSHEQNEFITLTYDEEHVPKTIGVKDFETGEVGERLTLKNEDLQKFMKRLRKYFKDHYNHENIRFYACGEYGSGKEYIDLDGTIRKGTERPHYHIIAFNLPLLDKKVLCVDKKGTTLYTSEIIEKLWGKGITSTADVTWESCAYVARYVMKKVKGKEAVELFKNTGRELEFTRMSRKPGIAREYYEEHKDEIYKYDELWIHNKKGTFKAKPARYYDKLYDLDNPEVMEKIKERRKEYAQDAEQIRQQNSEFTKLEYLAIQEDIKQSKLKQLKRAI